jgi:hypothetical protein
MECSYHIRECGDHLIVANGACSPTNLPIGRISIHLHSIFLGNPARPGISTCRFTLSDDDLLDAAMKLTKGYVDDPLERIQHRENILEVSDDSTCSRLVISRAEPTVACHEDAHTTIIPTSDLS